MSEVWTHLLLNIRALANSLPSVGYFLFVGRQALGHRQDQKIEQLHAGQQHVGDLERQLAAKVTENEVLLRQVAELGKEMGGLNTRFRELELSLAHANARVEASQGIGEELRGYLQSLFQPPTSE